MNKTRILTSVSVIALMTTTIVPGARADNAVFDLTAVPPTLTMATKSASVEAITQINEATKLAADTATVLLGIPDKNGGPVDLLGGTSDSLVVDVNTIFADAVSNTALNTIDLFTATGSGTTSAATLGVLQVTSSAGTAGLSGTVETSDIRINAQDIGAGGAASVTNSTIRATATGNVSASEISGNINPLLTSAELGQSKAQNKSPTLDADATVLVSTVQALSGIDAPLAGVSGSHIGIQATSDGVSTTQLDSVPLTETGNEINAAIVGNDATGIVFIENDKALTLTGSAGVSTLQYAEGDDPLASKIDTSRIEVGNAGTTPTADLLGSDVTFSLNATNTDATVNRAANTLVLDNGLSVAGISTQANTTTGSASSNVGGDLFIHNTQTSLVNTFSGSDKNVMSVLVQDVSASSVLVGDADLTDKSDTGNHFNTSATGNDATNLLQTGGGASFKGLAAINSTQVTAAQNAAGAVPATLLVSVGTIDSDGVVGRSAVTVDGNGFTVEGTGNRQASLIDIAATDITGDGVLGTPSVVVDRSNPHDAIESDFSLLSAQVLDGSGPRGGRAAASLVASVAVDVVNQAGAAGTSVANTATDVSGNSQTATAVGNLSRENGIDIDAGAGFTGTVGVINDQTVENGAKITSVNGGNGVTHYTVNVAPESITASSVKVEGNTITASSYANLSDGAGTSFSVSGVTVGDGDTASALLPTATVDRKTDTVPISTVNGSFALLNDQSAEDLGTITAAINQDYLIVNVGTKQGTTTFDKNDVSVSNNAALTQVTLNQATSQGTVTATGLNGSSVLVNTQTLADEDNDGKGGGINITSTTSAMTTTLGTANSKISASHLAMNGNSIVDRGAINLADNTLKVTAQTQTIAGAADSGVKAGQQSVNLDTNTAARGETLLVNDQSFDGLNEFTVDVSANFITAILSVGANAGPVDGTDVHLDDNAQLVYGAGNDATSTLTLDVQAFDLSDADAKAGTNALTGPIATLASNQRSADAADKGATITLNSSFNKISLSLGGSGLDTNDGLHVGGNSIKTFGRVNNAVNTLTATGTSFDAPVKSTPTATLFGTGGDIVLDQTGFAAASRQENAYNVSVSTIDFIGMDTSQFIGSSLTVENNLIDGEAHGNTSANTLTLDFGANQAQGFIANQQSSTAADPVLSVTGFVDEINLTGTGGDTSSFSLVGNRILAIAGTNQTENSLTSKGTDVAGGSGAAPSVLFKANGEMAAVADLGIVNAQGGATTADTATDTINISLQSSLIQANLNAVATGSVTVDNNIVQAQGITHSAGNDLNVDASAAVESLGAIVASQQVVTAGSTVSVVLVGTNTGALSDLSDPDSAAVEVSGNRFTGLAMGGTVTNNLNVTAGAPITGTAAAPTPSIGTASLALDADFDVANVQLGKAASISTQGGNGAVFIQDNGDAIADLLTVDNNLIQSQSIGFEAANVLTLDAGSSSDATASVASHQLIDGTAISSYADGMFSIIANDIQGSGLVVSNNRLASASVANSALNELVTSAGASLQESAGAGSAVDPGGATPLSITGADYSVLNWQETASGTALTSTIGNPNSSTAIFISGLPGHTVNQSSLAVDGNSVQAQAVANDATNFLVLNSGTFQHPSAAVASLQTTNGTTVSAAVDSVSIGIGLLSPISGPSANSSLSVSGNSVGAVAIGNRAVSGIGGQ